MAFELKSEILTRISQTQDENMRIILLLLLGVMEYSTEEIKKVGDKIDDLRRDEVSLRKTVLNGLAETHHEDHEWLNDHRKFSEANQALIDRAKPLMGYVERKMREEDEARANKKSWPRKFADAVISQAGAIVVTAIAVYAGFIK